MYQVQRAVWFVGVTLVGKAMATRDRVLRRILPGRGIGVQERVGIASGEAVLDARFVQPEATARAAMLICPGIGEAVEHWRTAQELLAEHGVASLVFSYAGTGRSSGWVAPEGCERDAIAACMWLEDRVVGAPVTLLGLSLGTGVASAVVARLGVQRLVLCEGFPTFRRAVRMAGLPGWMGWLVLDCWRSVETLRGVRVPVLVVHGACDRLFPVAMGAELAVAAGTRGELAVIPGMGHPDLHSRARPEDWKVILERIVD